MELYLCYAGFAYYVSQKGYRLVKYGNSLLSLFLNSGESFVFSVHFNDRHEDCGVVYTNYKDLEYIFNKDQELLEKLKNVCVKPETIMSGKISSHCLIDPSLWGKLITVIDGETIRCLRREGG